MTKANIIIISDLMEASDTTGQDSHTFGSKIRTRLSKKHYHGLGIRTAKKRKHPMDPWGLFGNALKGKNQ